MGHVFAQKELAGRYTRGDGVCKNHSAALLWFTVAEAVPPGFGRTTGLTADETAKITQKAERWKKQRRVPRGKFLFVEVYFSIKLWKDKELQEGNRETFRAPCTFFEDPLLGFQFSVMNVRIARDILWRCWSTVKESLEADKKTEQVFFIKREYWTDQNSDRRFVANFVKAFGDFPNIPTEF